MPSHPDEQRLTTVQRFHENFQRASILFTNNVYQRTLNLFDEICVNEIETYPSKYFKRIIQMVDDRSLMWKRAFKFIVDEQEAWPDVKLELMLMDFLFNPENKIKREVAVMIICLLMDLQEDYRFNTKRGFMRYILQSDVEKQRLQLELEPPDFPIVTIKAPVPWKCSVQVAKNRLEEVLMVNHPVLQAIQILWHNLYHDLLIVDTAKFYKGEVPYHAENITEIINSCCKIARDVSIEMLSRCVNELERKLTISLFQILVNDWMPRIADLIEAMQDYWRDLVPRNSPHGGRAQILFNCIQALLSLHLQGLIKRSIDHLTETVEVYKHGNLLQVYNPRSSKLKRRPFMTLIVSVVGKHDEEGDEVSEKDSALYQIDEDDPNILSMELKSEKPIMEERSASFVLNNSGKMIIEPYMEELPELFKSYFVKILKVGYKIPRLEYYMTQNKALMGHLHYISESHVDMVKLYDKIKKIVKANQTGPTTYLYPMYRFYFPILANKMKHITESIFSLREIPSLQVCV